MQFELYTFNHIIWNRVAIAPLGTGIGQFCQIVSFKLDSVDLIVATQLLDFLLAFFGRQLVLAILIRGKLVVKLLLRKLLPPFFFSSEAFRDGEERHNRVIIKTVGLYLIQYLQRVSHCFRHIAEDVVHLLTCLKPLLLGVEHSRRVIEILAGRETEKMVVGLSIFLIHKVGIVRTDQFDTIFPSQFDQHLIGLLLKREGLAIGTLVRICHLMALKLQIIVVAPEPLMPLDGFTCPGYIATKDLCRHLASNTG